MFLPRRVATDVLTSSPSPDQRHWNVSCVSDCLVFSAQVLLRRLRQAPVHQQANKPRNQTVQSIKHCLAGCLQSSQYNIVWLFSLLHTLSRCTAAKNHSLDITGCAVAQYCCNDDQQSQWKNADYKLFPVDLKPLSHNMLWIYNNNGQPCCFKLISISLTIPCLFHNCSPRPQLFQVPVFW